MSFNRDPVSRRLHRPRVRVARRLSRRHRRRRRRLRMQLMRDECTAGWPLGQHWRWPARLWRVWPSGRPRFAGVLPEDRADVLYHRYRAAASRSRARRCWCARRSATPLAVTANYYKDMISSASIDVKLSASPYKETAQAEERRRSTTCTARPPTAPASSTARSRTTVEHGLLLGQPGHVRRPHHRHHELQARLGPASYRDIKDRPARSSRTTRHSTSSADHRGYLRPQPDPHAQPDRDFNYEVITDQGYLATPIARSWYLDPTSGKGFTLADQIYPNTRTSNAASLDAEVLPAVARRRRAAVPLLHGHLGHRRPTRSSSSYTHPWRQLDLRRQLALLPPERGRLLQRHVPARGLRRTSWRATASWRRSRAIPSASARELRVRSLFAYAPWINKSSSTCASTTCSSTTATSATRC